MSENPLEIGFIPEEMKSEYAFSFPEIKPEKSFILLSSGTAFGLANLLNKPKYASYPDASMNFAIALEEMRVKPTKLGEVCLGLGKVSPKIYPDFDESASFDLEFDQCLFRGLSARRVTKNENVLQSFNDHIILDCASPSTFNYGEISEPMQKIQQHLLSQKNYEN